MEKIKQDFDNLIKEITTLLDKGIANEEKEKLLNAFDFKLREHETELKSKENKLNHEYDELTNQKTYLDKYRMDLKIREEDVIKKERRVEEASHVLVDLEEKKKEIEKKQTELAEKIKNYKDVDNKFNEAQSLMASAVKLRNENIITTNNIKKQQAELTVNRARLQEFANTLAELRIKNNV
jgi:chromosome segregation ATPase